MQALLQPQYPPYACSAAAIPQAATSSLRLQLVAIHNHTHAVLPYASKPKAHRHSSFDNPLPVQPTCAVPQGSEPMASVHSGEELEVLSQRSHS